MPHLRQSLTDPFRRRTYEVQVCPAADRGPGEYLELRVQTTSQGFPGWQAPVTVHMRHTDTGWQTAGLERMP